MVLLAAVVLGLVALALLSLRFGADTGPTLRSAEDVLARRDMTRDDTPAQRPDPRVTRVLVMRAPGEPFPTLRVIDAARGADVPAFGADPEAARLEVRARELTADLWSEQAWLTGFVPHARFEHVCAALERERSVRVDDVTLFIARETASGRRAAAS